MVYNIYCILFNFQIFDIETQEQHLNFLCISLRNLHRPNHVSPCSHLIINLQITYEACIWFMLVVLSIFAHGFLELRWNGVSLQERWRNQQFWEKSDLVIFLVSYWWLKSIFALISVPAMLLTLCTPKKTKEKDVFCIR